MNYAAVAPCRSPSQVDQRQGCGGSIRFTNGSAGSGVVDHRPPSACSSPRHLIHPARQATTATDLSLWVSTTIDQRHRAGTFEVCRVLATAVGRASELHVSISPSAETSVRPCGGRRHHPQSKRIERKSARIRLVRLLPKDRMGVSEL